MLNNSLLWQLAYHLCGLKLLGRTSQEPLGTLPVSVKTAVLEIAHEVHPDEIKRRSVERQLLKAEDPKRATYRWLESWCFVHNDVKDIILKKPYQANTHAISLLTTLSTNTTSKSLKTVAWMNITLSGFFLRRPSCLYSAYLGCLSCRPSYSLRCFKEAAMD